MSNEISKNSTKRSGFSSTFGFIIAAAGSAIGLGNIWRFPYICAKDGGGLFVLLYVILALTFGFALLATEISIGRKAQVGPINAYSIFWGNKKGEVLGWLATIIPLLIFPYYCTIGGWVCKYATEYVTGAQTLSNTTSKEFFNDFTGTVWPPIIFFLIFVGLTALVVFLGVDKGIEKVSKILMPLLFVLIVVIAVYVLTLSYTDENGETRTAMQGLGVYLIPDFSKITVSSFFTTLLDAAGQIFYSLSIAMGIMITYGSYTPKTTNVIKSINNIEIFDSLVALLAGVIIIPSVFVFQGTDGLASSGPSLMFVTLPKVFSQMGTKGIVIGALFFFLVFFAALTSSISLLEAMVSSFVDRFKMSRKKALVVVLALEVSIGIIVCLGYNVLFFDVDLGVVKGQILDILDFVSNYVLMPIVALLTCILVGWIMKPDAVVDEIKIGLDGKFHREGLYRVMIKYVCPIVLVVLLFQAFGAFNFLG